MPIHFGFNCKRLLPTIGKCRQAITDFSQRTELIESRWVDAATAIAYLDIHADELVRRTADGEIPVKRIKKGRHPVELHVSGPWEWDNCPLHRAGGHCLFFEAHDGSKVNCVADLANNSNPHPNSRSILSGERLGKLEMELLATID